MTLYWATHDEQNLEPESHVPKHQYHFRIWRGPIVYCSWERKNHHLNRNVDCRAGLPRQHNSKEHIQRCENATNFAGNDQNFVNATPCEWAHFLREDRQLQLSFSLSLVRAGYHGPGRATRLCAAVWIATPGSLSPKESCILVPSITVNWHQPAKGRPCPAAVYTLSFSSLKQEYECSVDGKWLHSLVVTKYVVILNWKALCICKIMYNLLWQ